MSCCLGNGKEPPFSLRPDRATAQRDDPAALTGRLHGDYVRQRFTAVKHKRRPASTVRTFVPDRETAKAEHYRPGTVEEGRAAKRSLIAVQFNHPEPDRWIPGLRYRSKPTTFYNGTGVGYVRKREWLYRGRNDPPPDPDEKMQIIRTKPQPGAWIK